MTELPFILPARSRVRHLRGPDGDQSDPSGGPTQRLMGFEPRFTDIVDFIVRITDEIWSNRAVGYIYETYDPSCTIYSPYGVTRSVEDVIASTVTTLNAFPDGEIEHLNVAWNGDAEAGFYTSHLGHSSSTNVGRTIFGPATGRRTSLHFAADCVSKNNRIHTEWLVRDNGAAVRQLGFHPHEVARRLAASPAAEITVVSPDARRQTEAARQPTEFDRSTVEGWAGALFHETWNLRRLDWLAKHYAEDVIAHAGGGRTAQGVRNYQSLILHVLAAVRDAVLRVHHVCHSEEGDGVIVAVRWTLDGLSAPGGIFGECPPGRPVTMMGISHLRLARGRIVEEWMLFDEVGTLVQVYGA